MKWERADASIDLSNNELFLQRVEVRGPSPYPALKELVRQERREWTCGERRKRASVARREHDLVDCDGGVCSLGVVHHYPHVGNAVRHALCLLKELRVRTSPLLLRLEREHLDRLGFTPA